jgi:hypothetical protein
MKCIQCNVDNNLKDRTANQGRCSNCKHPFAFEPTSMEGKLKFTDGFFAKALADISANGTLYFTRKQLLYLLEKRLARKFRSAIVIAGYSLVAFVGFFVLIVSGLGTIVLGYLFLIGVVIPFILRRWPPKWRFQQLTEISKFITITDAMVDDWLQQWQRFNPPPTRLLPPPSASASLASAADDDVTAYSFDRVLVCDSVAIAQLLIANNIHFEHNCAVLSISGYPQAIFATTMAMLRRNPDLQVIALHNCSPSGVALINELRTSPDWSIDSGQVIFDLGLLPRQVAAARGHAYIQISEKCARYARSMPQKVRQSLTATELKWLEAGYFVDLESFTPQKLMQIVSQGIGRMQNLGEDVGDNLILVGGFGGDDVTFVYAPDNFG